MWCELSITFCITRFTLVNSFIKLILLCKRPAVSIIITSAFWVTPDCKASKATEAGSDSHLLFNHWHIYTIRPNLKLIDCSSSKRICSSKTQRLILALLKLISQLTNGGRFTYTINTNNHKYVWYFRTICLFW